MKQTENHIETLTEIRSLMERSTKFISLSGFSGVFAGTFALIGAAIAWFYLRMDGVGGTDAFIIQFAEIERLDNFYLFFFVDASSVLVLSLGAAVFFTIRRARRNKLAVWDASARRLLINLVIPLVSGGIFCLILLFHHVVGLIAPATLIFYGISLINASKYTLSDIRTLGLIEILLGLISAVFTGYGLIFWALGFGLLHIIYGGVMYYKYER